MKKSILAVMFLILLAASVFIILQKDVFAGWLVSSQGKLIYEPDGLVLGREEKNNNNKQENNPSNNNQRNTDEGKRVILERKGQRVGITLKDEAGEEIDLPAGSESGELEIEEPEDKTTTKVKSNGNAFVIIRDKIAAQTHFPLMVNLETNELIVTTPAGQKIVTVLPDQAVKNMLAANVIDQLGGKGGLLWLEEQERNATDAGIPDDDESTESGGTGEEEGTETGTLTETTPEEEGISLTTTNDGTLAYKIQGVKDKKFLGLFKVKIYKTVTVSAETGELLGTQESLRDKVLDTLSL